jgi:tetratricopeptide (TPR) repeat protein
MTKLINLSCLCAIICFFITSCAHSQECVVGINKLPMYGNVKKCKEYIADDKEFIALCDKEYKTRQEAAGHMVMRGWQYLYAKKLDTSMMRFNQAWLLDSLNAEVYWGFGNLLGMQGKFKESIQFFERSIKLNPNNAKMLQDASTTFGNVFFETKDVKYLNETINVLKAAANIDKRNPRIYAQLTGAYSYFAQKDSARKYLKITDEIDPSAVNPEVRIMLAKK